MWCLSSHFGARMLRCMVCYRFLLLIVLFSSLSAQPSVAGESDYILSHFTTENGLPQNSIKGLAFDRLGYCWIGTENGLIKYDGIKFRLYEDYQVSPRSARIAFVKQGANDEVLIGIEGGQLYRIREVDHFGTVPVADSGRYLWRNGREFVQVKSIVTKRFSDLIKTYVRRVDDDYFLTNKNELYIKTVDSLVITAADMPVAMVPWQNLHASAATLVDGHFIVITSKNASIVDIKGHISQPISLKGKLFKDMDLDRRNYSLVQSDSVTYGFCKGTLYRLAFRGNALESFPVISGLGDISISDIYLSAKSGTYYLQSRTDGLVVAKARQFHNAVIPNSDWKQNSFYGQNLYGKNQIIANGYMFSFQDQAHNPQVKKLFTVGNLFSAFIDGDDYYYESGFKLFRLNLKSGQQEMIKALNDLAHCYQRSPYNNKVYFSTTNKLFSLNEGRPKWELSFPSDLNGYIYSFAFMGPDSVLVATSNGLWSANLNTGNTRLVVRDINVRNIYLGKDGYIWLATYNQGCLILNAGTPQRLPMDPNNNLAVVNSILEDKVGRIWFSTNKGLLSTNRQALLDNLSGSGLGVIYHIYDKSDGLITNEFNGAATPDKVYLSDGRVSLPSLKSLVLFNPEAVPVDSSGKKVFLDEVNVDGVRKASISNLVLPPGFGSMKVSVSASWSNKVDALYFERKINGGDWIAFRATDDIELRDLAYGDYLLSVRVMGRPGSQMQLKFHVAPHFYEMLWFKMTVTLVTMLIIILFFRASIRHYRNENLILDQRIKQRTRELNDSLQHLNATVSQLQRTETQLQTNVQQKEQIINMLLHDMKSPLFALKYGIEELDYTLSMQISVTDEVLRKSHLLREGISDVYSFSVNFFDWVKYQKEGITANYQLTNLNNVFSTIEELYGGIARRKGVDFHIEPCDITFYTDENILVTILRNLVDNAIKNTISGRVSLLAETNQDNIKIAVRDTGPGMEPSMLDMFNEAFYDDGTLDGQVGYGYRLIVHLASLIHADVELENNAGLHVSIYLNLITRENWF
jgi:signal transduction histidine kinase